MIKQPKIRENIDQDGNEIKFDIREDEEQSVKLTQIVELLLAAGYFRARIKGLSPFDKVVGGMTWCITTCNFDVDVDLLFQENSTIGQKIALTEKIVAVLPKMKCPHRIEPHQIQGLDFIHIYPVVQWLVKRAIETREEMGDYIRAYSISQFEKHHSMPEDVAFEEKKLKSTGSVKNIQHVYRPQRRYRRHHTSSIEDEESRVQCTLLEYGQRRGYTKAKSPEKETDARKKAAAASLEAEEEAKAQEEEKRIKKLLSGMSSTEGESRLTASAIGNIVGLQSQHIQQMASQYAEKQAELEGLEKSGLAGGAQHHQRQVVSLQKQLQQQSALLEKVEEKHRQLQEQYEQTQQKLQERKELSERIDEEMEKLNAMETEDNKGVLESLRNLVAMNENLKKQEQQFKVHCKEEMTRLQENIDKLKTEGGGVGEDTEEEERSKLIEKQHEADKEKLQKIRLLLGRKNREISALHRKIDEVPSRAELSQYQRRFVELYNQVASTHKETKQFYTLYNTLDDTKLYLNKEITLLNSIYDNFTQAMSSQSGKEQFLKQLENIVEGVKGNKIKLEKRKQEEKMKRDQANDQHLNLLEKHRLYFKTVKDFQEECRKNEILLKKLQGT